MVAQRFLAEVHLPDEVIAGCVQLCKEFHMSTRDLSQRFWNELKRHNYVTPTSYLELISTYKTLLSKKQEYVFASSIPIFSLIYMNRSIYHPLSMLFTSVYYATLSMATIAKFKNLRITLVKMGFCFFTK